MNKGKVLLFLIPFILRPNEAHAYVDPGTGGYVFQILFLLFSAAVAFLAYFKDKIKGAVDGILSFFKNLFGSRGT